MLLHSEGSALRARVVVAPPPTLGAVLCVQRARAMARLLLLAACGIGLVLGVVVWAVPRVWGHVLAADVAVRRGVVGVSAQNAVCSWLCALAVVLDGVAIGSGAPRRGHTRGPHRPQVRTG